MIRVPSNGEKFFKRGRGAPKKSKQGEESGCFFGCSSVSRFNNWGHLSFVVGIRAERPRNVRADVSQGGKSGSGEPTCPLLVAEV